MKTSLLMNFYVDKENNQIKVEREFAAPLSNVWAAWTEPQLLDQWWAPRPWKAQTKSMDFKEGGYWLYAMVGPEGEKHWARADFQAIALMESFSAKDAFCDEEGIPNDEFPSSTWTNVFSKDSDTTTVSIMIQYSDFAQIEAIMQMGFKEGFTAALTNLDALLEE
jgi:uncharacterized protein YndB with AHSA1/START domain